MNPSNRLALWMLGGAAAGFLVGFLFVTIGLETEQESADGRVSVWGLTLARAAVVEHVSSDGGSPPASLWGRRLQLGCGLAGALFGVAMGAGLGAQNEINRLEDRLRKLESRQALHRL